MANTDKAMGVDGGDGDDNGDEDDDGDRDVSGSVNNAIMNMNVGSGPKAGTCIQGGSMCGWVPTSERLSHRIASKNSLHQ